MLQLQKAWRIIRAMITRTSVRTAPLADTAATATTPLAKATLLNSHYAARSQTLPPLTSRPQREVLHQARETLKQARQTSFSPDRNLATFNQPFSAEELDNAVSATAKCKASGLDGLAPDFFHHLGQLAKKELLLLINLSWISGRLPNSWKNGLVTAVPKAGKPPSNPSSYRPIALLNLIPKIMERMVYAQIVHFAETHNLFSPAQAGF